MAARAKADGGDLLAQAEGVIDRHNLKSQNWKERAKLEVGPFVRAAQQGKPLDEAIWFFIIPTSAPQQESETVLDCVGQTNASFLTSH